MEVPAARIAAVRASVRLEVARDIECAVPVDVSEDVGVCQKTSECVVPVDAAAVVA